MKYIEVEFSFDPEVMDGEIVLAEISELPFESFAEETGKIMAYAQEEDFDKNALEAFQWLKEHPLNINSMKSAISIGTKSGKRILIQLK